MKEFKRKLILVNLYLNQRLFFIFLECVLPQGFLLLPVTRSETIAFSMIGLDLSNAEAGIRSSPDTLESSES